MDIGHFLRWTGTAPAGERADAAFALAKAYVSQDFDVDVRSEMEAAMTVLLDDASPDVRFALADALASSPAAPRHILLALAADQPDVASLVLSRSPVFIDAELVEIAAAGSASIQVAIAARPRVSSAVAAAVAEVGEPAACLKLLDNGGATIARISLRRMAERHGEDAEVRDALLGRPNLPSAIRQLLIRRLSDALGTLITVNSWVPEERARTLTRDACDRATVSMAAETESEELGALVEHLRVTGQLTTALLLRAVCAGNVAFFEAALAVLSGMPEARVVSLVRGGRMTALRAVYQKAHLPPTAFAAFAAALDTCRKLAEEGGPSDRYQFTRHMVESVLARYRDITDGEMNELTAMLRRIGADQAREAARDYAARIAAA